MGAHVVIAGDVYHDDASGSNDNTKETSESGSECGVCGVFSICGDLCCGIYDGGGVVYEIFDDFRDGVSRWVYDGLGGMRREAGEVG